MKTEKNYWPLGLAVFGVALIAGLAAMVGVAVQYPVEFDGAKMAPYRYVDANYNKIIESEKKFDEKYIVQTSHFTLLKNTPTSLELNVSDKSGKDVDANITAIVTRPDTSKHDITINEFNKTSISYLSKPFSVGLEGRWKIMYRVEVGGLQKFVDLETFVNKSK